MRDGEAATVSFGEDCFLFKRLLSRRGGEKWEDDGA